MTTLVLIRHGQTDWNVEGRWQGQSNPPLNRCGRQEAQRTAQELQNLEFAALYSSDLRRAMETAQIIRHSVHSPVVPDPRLREIHLGKWQRMLSSEIQIQYPDEFQLWHSSPLSVHPPGGEDIQTLATRVMEAVNEIIARHPDQRVGVVAHELPIAAIVCRSMGLSLEHLRDLIPRTGTWCEVVVSDLLR